MPVAEILPPIADQPLSVVLLAHEDAGHIAALLDAWTQTLDARGQEYELLLVDDGSSDGTADRALELATTRPRLRVLRHAVPQGEGAALRTGVTEAKYPLLFQSLCKPAYCPEDLALLLDRVASPPAQGKDIDQVHILTGFRAGVPVPRGLRIVGWFWRLFCRVLFSASPDPLPGWLGWRGYAGWLAARILFGLRYRDTACPVRLMRRSIFVRIPIQSSSRFAHVEVLAKANFLGHLMGEEVPLPLSPQPYPGDFRLLWRDCLRLLRKPSFGPTVLPAPAEGPTATAPAG